MDNLFVRGRIIALQIQALLGRRELQEQPITSDDTLSKASEKGLNGSHIAV